MAIFMPETSLTGGVKIITTFVAPNAIQTHVHLSLVSSNWAANAGLGSVDWGVEASFDVGNTWIILGGTSSNFGAFNLDKAGQTLSLMPTMGISRLNKQACLWRVYVNPTANISVGITGGYDNWPSP